MKILYSCILLAVCSTIFSQQATIELSADSICLGQSITATAHPPMLEVSGASGTNNHNGVMFDITATAEAVIQDFTINNLTSVTDFVVYYRPGSHVGFENSAAGWTLLDSAKNVSVGNDIQLNLNLNQTILNGQTLAFYISTLGPTDYMSYGNGTSVGTVINSNAWIQVKEGVGKAYPFGNTFTPRTFIGKVHMTPAVNNITWNTGSTNPTITLTPDRTTVLRAVIEASANSTFTTPTTLIPVMDLDVTIDANPPQILPGESSTLTHSLVMSRGVSTTMEGGNSQNGAMFDVTATADIKIEGFTVNTLEVSATADIEILYKPGSHVGFEANAGAWTSLGTFTNVPAGVGRYLELNTQHSIANGQSMAFYITRTDNNSLIYSNGTGVGNVAATSYGIQVKEGVGVSYPFGNTFTPRILNTVIHYNVENPSGTTFNWSSGGSGGSITVSPNTTTNYTLTVTKGGCSFSDSLTLVVSGIGLDENSPQAFLVYPNPATEAIFIELPDHVESLKIQLTDLTGKVVMATTEKPINAKTQVSLLGLSTGLYILQITHNQSTWNYKIQVQE